MNSFFILSYCTLIAGTNNKRRLFQFSERSASSIRPFVRTGSPT